ncbi:MAG: helix-turn-helix domain-containing protein [Firmicutes bacterium]|nr:helix-turn-helix domain-containing protein [Bacillota bacterium]
MKILKDFGDRLTELMLFDNLTTEELAKRLNIGRSTVHLWKTGKRNITLSNALKLAEFFECSLDFLLGRSDDKLSYTPRTYPPFYDRLLQIIDEKGMTRYRLVKDTKISDGNLYSWKNGGNPFIQTVIDLADYFGYTLDCFIGLDK